MRLRFSEDPGEWRKFTCASAVVPVLFCVLGAWRGRWAWAVPGVAAAIACGVALVAAVRPGWFRGWYRAGRRFGHFMGRVMGGVVLTLLFVLLLAPLGIVLRLLGREPLGLRPDPKLGTYWVPSRQPGELERMF